MKVHHPKLYNMAHLLALNVFSASKGSNNYFYLRGVKILMRTGMGHTAVSTT